MDDDEEDVKEEKVRRRVPKGLETRATFSRRERGERAFPIVI